MTAPTSEHVPPPEPDNLVLQPRDVHFDWSGVPLHWIPGEPAATHFINVLHLLLPAGEDWFVRVFQQSRPTRARSSTSSVTCWATGT
jgi:predicted metal-dependent hydrolase